MRAFDERFFRTGFACDSDKRYKAEKHIAQRKHKVREGDWFWVNRISPDDRMRMKEYRVQAVQVTRWFIVLRYPAGFCEAAHWDDFERMLI